MTTTRKVTVQPPLQALFLVEGGNREAAAMKAESLGKVFQGVAVLPGTSLRNGEQACGSQRASIASITETSLTPLDGGAQRPFGAVVGRLHILLVEETE